MTTPTTTVTVEPMVITARPVQRRRREPVPTARPALTNRAAGRLRAEAAAAAPEDVGFAETRYKRTTEDDADVAAYQAAIAQGTQAPARPAEPEPEPGAYRGPAAPADTGLAGTRYERTAQDEADVATLITPQAEAGPASPLTAGRYAGAELPGTAFAAPRDVGASTARYEPTAQDAADVAAAGSPLYPGAPQAQPTAATAAPQAGALPAPAPGATPVPSLAPAGARQWAQEFRAHAAAAARGLAHPALPGAAAARRAFEGARERIEAEGAVRTNAARAAPAQLVGPAPTPARRPPREDPGPIPEQLRDIEQKAGLTLPEARLPGVTRSPRGTLPDVTGPVLSQDQIREIRIGDAAIALLDDRDERERLAKIRASMDATAKAPVPDAVSVGGAAPSSVPVSDEPVSGLVLGPEQRALFTSVVGELLTSPDASARQVLAAAGAHVAAYPGGVLLREFPDLGAAELPGLTKLIRAQAAALAAAIHVAPDQLDAAIAQRKEELEAQRQAAAQASAEGAGLAVAAAHRSAAQTTATSRAAGAATVRAVSADASGVHARNPHSVQARVERAVARIREQVSSGLARYDTLLRNRERAIADAVRRQISAYRLAQTRDEIALGDAVASQAQAAEVRRWADAAIAALVDGDKSAQQVRLAEARAATKKYKDDLEAAGGTAFDALHDWGKQQSTATETWWTALDAGLQTWSKKGVAQAAQWTTARGETARLSLAQDLAAVRRLVELRKSNDREAMRLYMSGLDAEGKAVVGALLGTAQGAPADVAGALAAGIREGVRAEQQPALDKDLAAELMAKPVDKDSIKYFENMLKVVQPGWSAQEAAHTINESVARWRGFDEAAIFRALTGLTPLAVKVLRAEYERTYHQELDAALRGKGHVGKLNDDEVKAAVKLLQGDAAAGAAGAIQSALEGIPCDIDTIKQILRRLPADQRPHALKIYRELNHQSLSEALAGQWISQSQRDEALALSTGDIHGADAIALGRAVEERTTAGDDFGGGERYATLDRGKAQAVFASIRAEVQAEGTQRGWTSAQVEAEIGLRNRETEAEFDKRFAGQWWAQQDAGGKTAMRAAFELEGGAGRDLLNAVADNNLARVDVARLRLEDQGWWAEDAAINAVFRDQASRSLEEVQRDLGPILRARTEAQLDREDRYDESGKPRTTSKFDTPLARVNERMKLESANAKTMAALADAKTRQRMDNLGTLYQAAAGRSLKEMAEANMSGTAREEAKARIESHGVLTNYQRLRFSIEGLGTDLPMLRSTLAGMSKNEMTTADADWRAEPGHHGESLLAAVKGDTSGRDKDDLTDLVENGAPQTAEEVVAAARRKFNRDNSWTRGVGALLAYSEAANAKREVEGLEADLELLKRRDLKPDQRQSAMDHFDIAVERVNNAIEFQRQAVDSWADTLSTAAAIAAAVVVGIVLAPFTAGGSGVVAAAVIASLVATGASMLTKALVKGGAYGTEEIWTDVAVGAVDALFAALTAGLGPALLGTVRKGLGAAGREAITQSASKIGRAGAVAGARGRFASLLAKSGSRGALTRAIEGRALLGGLAAETSPLYQRLAARGAALLIEQTVQAVPSQFVGALMDERVWRQPGGGPQLVLTTTLEGTAHGVAFGMLMHGALHHVVVPTVREVISRFGDASRIALPERGLPGADTLARMGSVRERLAEFRAWERANPGGDYRQFYAEREARLVEASATEGLGRERVRAARAALLSELPPAERGHYADVPIVSASDAEFRRLGGADGREAHLAIRDAQAMIVLREGTPPGAAGLLPQVRDQVAGLLPQVRDQVIARSGGITLEGGLPERLRQEVQIRRDPTLHTDTVRVIPIPPDGGAIRGVEIHVGPHVRQVDIALHVGEVDRIRRWTGRVGAARMAVARLAELVGVHMESPRDRARFEAAGEIRKLGPIIEERIRRLAAASGDPVVSARVEAETLHLLAQQERARRILTGELVTEARGYIASEGLPERPTVQAVRARELLAEISSLREGSVPPLERRLRSNEMEVGNEAARIYNRLVNEQIATPEQLGGDRDEFKGMAISGGEDARGLRERVLASIARADAETAADLRQRLAKLDEWQATMEATHAQLRKVQDAIQARRQAFESLPEREQHRAHQNQDLTYDQIMKGPESVCLAPGTPVATPFGQLAIEELRPGNEILAADPADGVVSVERVVRCVKNHTDWFVEVIADGKPLYATRGHRIRVSDPDRWVPARLITPGMRLRAYADTTAMVSRTRLVHRELPTHNLEISRVHTFFAGEARVLVHNADPDLPPRNFKSETRWTGEIYYVSIMKNGQWEVVYVGSTNKEGLTFARFQEHLREGRPGAANFRQNKAEWLRLVSAGGGDTEVGASFRRWGEIKVEVKEHGEFTDLGLAILEEAHIRKFDENQLQNRVEALSEKAFKEYYNPSDPSKKNYSLSHEPCR